MLSFYFQATKPAVGRNFSSMFRHLGALGLFFLAILDSSPLPTFGGPDILVAILSVSHPSLWYGYSSIATLGSVIGAYLTYRLAQKAGSTYLTRKFRQGRVAKFLQLFNKWGTGTLIASTAIPLPFPTSMIFAAAGASNYRTSKFLAIVTVCRAARYSAIAFAAVRYGRHLIRVLRHPNQHWGWLLLFATLVLGLIATGIWINRRLDATSAD